MLILVLVCIAALSALLIVGARALAKKGKPASRGNPEQRPTGALPVQETLFLPGNIMLDLRYGMTRNELEQELEKVCGAGVLPTPDADAVKMLRLEECGAETWMNLLLSVGRRAAETGIDVQSRGLPEQELEQLMPAGYDPARDVVTYLVDGGSLEIEFLPGEPGFRYTGTDDAVVEIPVREATVRAWRFAEALQNGDGASGA